ncbi:hypothetical protein [Buchananella hordeovulneris]|uniref:hypothetical protein n=1 Tax=Buchananella hordeovulneris TaxID=52770 RepID=UPI0009FCC3A0|nr:hypothetical protein [Buchananella hordeovulneris]
MDATAQERQAFTAMVVYVAEQAFLHLTPFELAVSPVKFRCLGRTSVFGPKHSAIFSSQPLLAAEDLLLQRARATTGPSADLATVETVTSKLYAEGRMPGLD